MRRVGAIVFFAIILIAGCAIHTGPASQLPLNSPLWHGRLAVQIESDQALSEPSSFSAEFELTGSPEAGELTIYTPIGTTAATLSWSPQSAVMRTNSDTRSFESLGALLKQAVGTDIPVAALFAWLAGDNLHVAGWNSDLSQHANGRITARRTTPAPVTELRLVIDK